MTRSVHNAGNTTPELSIGSFRMKSGLCCQTGLRPKLWQPEPANQRQDPLPGIARIERGPGPAGSGVLAAEQFLQLPDGASAEARDSCSARNWSCRRAGVRVGPAAGRRPGVAASWQRYRVWSFRTWQPAQVPDWREHCCSAEPWLPIKRVVLHMIFYTTPRFLDSKNSPPENG